MIVQITSIQSVSYRETSERYKDKKGTFTFFNKVLNLNFRQHQERTQEQIPLSLAHSSPGASLCLFQVQFPF